MRNPEQVLNILAGHSNEPEYKYERLYRILFNEQMFFVAYQRMYAKPGNMTPGTDGKTEDEIRSFIAHKLGIHISAFVVRQIDEIPKNNSGKVLYAHLSIE